MGEYLKVDVDYTMLSRFADEDVADCCCTHGSAEFLEDDLPPFEIGAAPEERCCGCAEERKRRDRQGNPWDEPG